MDDRCSAASETVAPRGRLLPATRAATRLGISYWALLRLINAERIAVMRTPEGRLLGIYEADCDDWIARSRTPAKDVGPEPSSLRRQHVDQLVDALLGDDERVF